MSVSPGDTITGQFTTRNFGTGAIADADALPTGVLVRNGDDTAEVVTVTKLATSTGKYKWSATVPGAWDNGDDVAIRIAATVDSVSDHAVVWQTKLDAAISSRSTPADILVTPANKLAVDATGHVKADAAKMFGNAVGAEGMAAAGVAYDSDGYFAADLTAIGDVVLTGGQTSALRTLASDYSGPERAVFSDVTKWRGTVPALLDGSQGRISARLVGAAATDADAREPIRDGLATPASVWAHSTRTLSSFGTLVADIATDVWGATTRTLTAFGFTVATDSASRNASKADVTGLALQTTAEAIKTKTDQLSFTGAAGMLLSEATNMRGTDGANTVAPATPANVEAARDAIITQGDSAWATANVSAIPTLTQLQTEITSLQTHGDSTWATATGFIKPGDAVTLTAAERTAIKAAIEAEGGMLEIVNGLIVALTEDDGAGSDRFSAKALEQAPAGGGGGGVVGPGAKSVTLTLALSDTTPIADARVWITTDEAGSNVVAGTLTTDAAGEVTFKLDDGVTYYRWAKKSGLNFTNPQSFTA